LYEIGFGFMPRMFKNSAEDRYLYEEELDVTEIYFILKGEWAISFNSYWQIDEKTKNLFDKNFEDEVLGPEDMKRKGHLIAQKRTSYGYIGDYYVLSSKPS